LNQDGSYDDASLRGWVNPVLENTTAGCCLTKSDLNGAVIQEQELEYIQTILPEYKDEYTYIPWYPGAFNLFIEDSHECTLVNNLDQKCWNQSQMLAGPSGTSMHVLLKFMWFAYGNYDENRDWTLMASSLIFGLIAWLGPQGDHSIKEILSACAFLRYINEKQYGSFLDLSHELFQFDENCDERDLVNRVAHMFEDTEHMMRQGTFQSILK